MAKPLLPMSPPPMPLAAHTSDRFGSIGKLVEEKNVRSINAVNPVERQCITMDLAVKEALMPRTLLDQVRSLENRLLQLCMDLESQGVSLPDTPLFQAFRETSLVQRRSNNVGSSSTSSSLGCRPTRNQTKSLTTSTQATIDKAKVKNKSGGEKKKPKKEDDEPKKKAMRSEREKKVVTKKNGKPSSWFHFRLLGC